MDGLQEMFGRDSVGCGQVSDRPGHAEDAVEGACGQREFFHGLLEQVPLRTLQGAVGA